MKSLKNGSTHTQQSTTPNKYAVAFEKTKAQRDALPANALVPTNFDIPAATATALAAFPGMVVYRPLLQAQLATFDLKSFDAIEDYANATFHAQRVVMNINEPKGLSAAYEEALSLREAFRADLQTLILRKVLDPKEMPVISNAVGYRNVAMDLGALVTAAERNFKTIEDKSALTSDEIASANDKAGALLQLSGLNERIDRQLVAARDDRHRALTLLVRAYDEARDAIGYVRRNESDVATIAPTLHVTRSRRRVGEVVAPPTITPVTTPAEPVVTPAPAPMIPLPVTTPVVAPPTNIAPSSPSPATPEDATFHVLPFVKKSA